MFINNSFIPLNKSYFVNELKRLGIPDAVIENINWKNCISNGYCKYNDKKNIKLCLTKIHKKEGNLCSIHIKRKRNYVNEIEEIDNMLEKMEIEELEDPLIFNCEDNLTNIMSDTEIETVIDFNETNNYKFINLDDTNIEKIFNNTKILLNNFNEYKKNNIDVHDLSKNILEYNKELYKSSDEPYIHISYLLQFLEELYEISNDFLNSMMSNYNNCDVFFKLCQEWKLRIKDIIKEIIIIPNYYKEYYGIINKKIDNNLFNFKNPIYI
jgi:hypothetical protein